MHPVAAKASRQKNGIAVFISTVVWLKSSRFVTFLTAESSFLFYFRSSPMMNRQWADPIVNITHRIAPHSNEWNAIFAILISQMCVAQVAATSPYSTCILVGDYRE